VEIKATTISSSPAEVRPIRFHLLSFRLDNIMTRIRLSCARRAMAAMLGYARKIPSIPVVRPINVAALNLARNEAREPVSWSSVFIRAYAIVCAQVPELRRVWISWPRPHLYEHPNTVCAVAVEREWEGEQVVLKGLLRGPESASLTAIQGHLRELQTAPVWSVSSYRSSLRFGQLPTLLQRFVLWNKLDVSGKRHVKYVGTFGMTNYGMLGAESLHPLGLQATVLTLGPIRANGDVNVKLVYDHRVLDGRTIARSLACLEDVLHGTILTELRQGVRPAA
jgi:hypothetical protein